MNTVPRSTHRKRLADTAALTLLEEAFASALRTKQLRRVLQGLLTTGQRTELAQRLRLAFFLRAGWSFRAIAAETGASTATVGAVHRFLLSLDPRYRPLIPLRHRPARTNRSVRDPFGNPYVPLSGKWLFRELTGTG